MAHNFHRSPMPLLSVRVTRSSNAGKRPGGRVVDVDVRRHDRRMVWQSHYMWIARVTPPTSPLQPHPYAASSPFGLFTSMERTREINGG
jgi:hypothetical protein